MIVIVNGKKVLDLPWQAAKNLAKAVMYKANKAEEVAKADKTAMDAAILLRSGAPFGITSNPAILKEAASLAAHDRDLRRFMPGGIKSETQFGQPGVQVLPPRKP